MSRIIAVVESKFDYKGRECIVMFNMLGFRCGYVSLKENENVDYGSDIDCHGGITFSGEIGKEYEPKYNNYAGFDCGHAGDGYDIKKVKEYGFDTT